jgi:beta-phosphoglucomutase-like phosphatase (HAD superfamily)
MIPDSALDTAVRQARHLLFAFNGPIHMGNPDDPTTPAAPYIGDAAAACRDSGRSFVVISTKPQIDVPNYLAANDLFTHVTVIAVSVRDAANYLESTRAACLLITSSPADIKAAKAAGTPSIGYA